MKKCLFAFFLLFSFGTLCYAQPGNDDCEGIIDLGVVPACDQQIYTNVNATASNIGFGNSPSCFNAGLAPNDVWFSFSTATDILDITVSVTGTTAGPNDQAITNPQIAIYRGDCEVDGLAEIACVTSPNGQTLNRLDLLALTSNTTYFVRISDFSGSASPNWGDFTFCVEEYVPAINIGDSPGSTACFGTLYDSGGPDGDYGVSENNVFTICPNDPHSCIEIDLVNFSMEATYDFLNFYAGDDTNAPLITSLTGFSNVAGFPIQATSDCITVQFTSDFTVVNSGFELTWQCSPLACDGISVDNPTVIGSIPFVQGGFSTCDNAATFAQTACPDLAFLNGPESVFIYESAGDECVSVAVTGAAGGTGVVVLSGPPGDPGSACIGQGETGTIFSANLQDPGTYYIIVANGTGCTNFGLDIQPATCLLSPALTDALCNPLNGCIPIDGLPSVFNFQQGFQDIGFNVGVNDGCWVNTGSAQPNYYWFSIEAQAAGPFGFIVQAALPEEQSDIDFSVWGPFSNGEVCETPGMVTDYIENNQPIRSSWSAGSEPTGLASIHPITGEPVTDPFDCGSPATPSAAGDDFVSVIQAQPGEVYIVLINDWGNSIQSGNVSVDWSPSAAPVLAPILPEVITGDTAICVGESAQIEVSNNVDNITWLNDTGTLSSTTCFDPVASPTETTVYRALVEAVCYTDTIEARVTVFDVDAGPDVSVCRNEEIQIVAGSNYENAAYSWTAPAGVTLSCTDCPDPVVSAADAGSYEISVTLISDVCTLSDDMTLEILAFDAPEYVISDDLDICLGETVNLGGSPTPGVMYDWSSIPAGLMTTDANPAVSPTTSTTYFLSVSNQQCPVPSLDSVQVAVFTDPVIPVGNDTTICQGDSLILGNVTIEGDVTYLWTGPDIIEDPADPNTVFFPQTSGTYTLTATRGACVVTATVEVEVTEIAVDILPNDTVSICRGESIDLTTVLNPADIEVSWTPDDGTLSALTGPAVTATPTSITTYFAQVSVPGCIRMDSVTVNVDSLPANLSIMPADTMVCEGSLVELVSPIYEPSLYPNIEFMWFPGNGYQTPDTLYNMVLTVDTTLQHYRVSTSGVCIDTAYAMVTSKPIPDIIIMPTDTTICEGESVQITTIITPEPDEIKWTPESNLSCTDCPNPVASPLTTTPYSIEATLDDCPAFASAVINVDQLPTINLVESPQFCEGEVPAIRLLMGPAEPNTTYTWTSPDDPSLNSSDPLLTVSPDMTTTYELVAENDCGPSTASVTVFVLGQFDFSVEDQIVCLGDPVTLTATGTAPDGINELFIWNYNGVNLSGESITIDDLTQTTDITVTYTYGAGCGGEMQTVTVTVVGEDFGVSVFADRDTVYSGETITLSADVFPQGVAVATYQWFADGELIGETTTPTFAYTAPAFEETEDNFPFSVIVITPDGCTRTDIVPVTILVPEFRIPNVFTPNGDQTNDQFLVLFRGAEIDVKDFKVFNRWGQVVYESTNNEGWDGQYKGEPAPSDVYIYMITFNIGTGERVEKGDVTLVR